MGFSESVKKFSEGSKKQLQKKTVEVANTLCSTLVALSPILPRSRYAEGEFVANWQLTTSPTSVHLNRRDPTKAIVMEEINSFLTPDFFMKNDVLYITNNTPYCLCVEYGWPWGTPGYFPRQSALRAVLSKYK